MKTDKCLECPAAAEWKYMGPGLWCCKDAYFNGKAGKPDPCKVAVKTCRHNPKPKKEK